MTITTAPVRQSFPGDGSVTAFPIPWKYFAKSDVVVTLRSSTGVETLQVITTNYTLTAAGVDSGGTCTMVAAPASGETLVITLDPPNTQASPLPLGGSFPSPVVEDAIDKLTQLIAKVEELQDRAMLVPKTDTQIGANLLIPIDSSRASKFLGWDANGKVIAASSVSNEVTISSFMETLLDDAAAVNGRQTLLLDKSGADIASAATIDLDASTGDFVDVTGTITITAVTLGDGVEKTVRFTGALTLTDGASLELPGNADIITVAGDIAVFRGDSGSVVRCVGYQRVGVTHPSFSVHKNATNQLNITGGQKITWSTELFDTNSDFASDRFTPTVRGKYLLHAAISWLGGTITDTDTLQIYLQKNGATVNNKEMPANGTVTQDLQVTAVVDANGTTDFFEIFAENSARNTSDISGNAVKTYFSGCRIDSAPQG